MVTATKFRGQGILRDLIPLNSLSTNRFLDIAKHLVIQDVGTLLACPEKLESQPPD